MIRNASASNSTLVAAVSVNFHKKNHLQTRQKPSGLEMTIALDRDESNKKQLDEEKNKKGGAFDFRWSYFQILMHSCVAIGFE
jgi:hypothetical protein